MDGALSATISSVQVRLPAGIVSVAAGDHEGVGLVDPTLLPPGAVEAFRSADGGPAAQPAGAYLARPAGRGSRTARWHHLATLSALRRRPMGSVGEAAGTAAVPRHRWVSHRAAAVPEGVGRDRSTDRGERSEEGGGGGGWLSRLRAHRHHQRYRRRRPPRADGRRARRDRRRPRGGGSRLPVAVRGRLAAQHLAGQTADLVRVAIPAAGGVTDVLKIARTAEAFGVNCEIDADDADDGHGGGSPGGRAAQRHVASLGRKRQWRPVRPC